MAFDSLPFKWTEATFATHNAEMDSEHQGLFAGIDKLDHERTTASFEALCGLVTKHFHDEEKLGLPAAHKKAHDDLVATATAKLHELKGGAKVDDGLVTFLKNWLKNHIKGTDIPNYGK